MVKSSLYLKVCHKLVFGPSFLAATKLIEFIVLLHWNSLKYTTRCQFHQTDSKIVCCSGFGQVCDIRSYCKNLFNHLWYFASKRIEMIELIYQKQCFKKFGLWTKRESDTSPVSGSQVRHFKKFEGKKPNLRTFWSVGL